MRAARCRPVDILLPAEAGVGRGSEADAADRRDPFGAAVLRQSPPARRARGPGTFAGQSQACTAADAPDGPGGAVPEATDLLAGRRAQGLSVPAARAEHRSSEPGLGGRHLLSADGQGLHVSRRDHGLALAARAVVARLEHARQHVLRRRGSRRRWRAMEHPRSSTPIKARSSHRRRSRACSRRTTLRSAWTAAVVGSTTCSSSGCGAV